ncbi:MepB family protein [Corynebacterium crudilactis]|uniref:Metallopeptidase n=1 Tax=Corynebacterium crudilactis TaxID=1652495 RepID=A0A172QSH3_9CORY|nr:MepB family protein [Corynebacterium crudilactis]ANE03645.1 metallopeptidase [Corynebacterium crudilactis]
MSFNAFEEYAAHIGMMAEVMSETQNSDYESGIAKFGNEMWHIRTSRNTPTKPGAFVAFWTREQSGDTGPFNSENVHAGLFVFVEQLGKRGVFRFTAKHLDQLGIISGQRSGKRGFRVYPSWCVQLNPQAQATQKAQAPAFQEY